MGLTRTIQLRKFLPNLPGRSGTKGMEFTGQVFRIQQRIRGRHPKQEARSKKQEVRSG